MATKSGLVTETVLSGKKKRPVCCVGIDKRPGSISGPCLVVPRFLEGKVGGGVVHNWSNQLPLNLRSFIPVDVTDRHCPIRFITADIYR